MNNSKYKAYLGIIILILTPLSLSAKPVACVGVSKKCTQDVRFDKTIEGQVYSCYECKQTVCKSGGSGPIAGTETSTVCESKGPTSRTMIRSQQNPRFDEADALFGKRSEVKISKANNVNTGYVNQNSQSITTYDHRKNKQRPNITEIKAPSTVTLYDVTHNQLSISWKDNAHNEYGVYIERGTPTKDRGGINYHWKHVFKVEERIISNVKGTGWRTDGDDGLTHQTQYCYRLRAYHKTASSKYSVPVCVYTSR